MSIDKQQTPFMKWRNANPHQSVSSETNLLIEQWFDALACVRSCVNIYYDTAEAWLTDQSKPEPDLVKFVANYGYTMTVTGNWKKMPIVIPDEELPEWEAIEWMPPTINSLRAYQASVPGIMTEMLGKNTKAVIELLNKQLSARYAELAELSNMPIEHFTPVQWDEEQVFEDEAMHELDDIGRIFNIYEELECFESGIELLRMLMITEDEPEFNLPNVGYYEALVSINSAHLAQAQGAAKPKLEAIIKYWLKQKMEYSGGKPFYQDLDRAPDRFWWRHWVRDHKGNGSNGKYNRQKSRP